MGRNQKIKALKKLLWSEIDKMPLAISDKAKEKLHNEALKKALRELYGKINKPTR